MVCQQTHHHRCIIAVTSPLFVTRRSSCQSSFQIRAHAARSAGKRHVEQRDASDSCSPSLRRRTRPRTQLRMCRRGGHHGSGGAIARRQRVRTQPQAWEAQGCIGSRTALDRSRTTAGAYNALEEHQIIPHAPPLLLALACPCAARAACACARERRGGASAEQPRCASCVGVRPQRPRRNDGALQRSGARARRARRAPALGARVQRCGAWRRAPRAAPRRWRRGDDVLSHGGRCRRDGRRSSTFLRARLLLLLRGGAPGCRASRRGIAPARCGDRDGGGAAQQQPATAGAARDGGT